MAKPDASAPLGQGGRFAALKQKLMAKGKSSSAAAGIAAKVGRDRYGAKKMASMAAAGRKS